MHRNTWKAHERKVARYFGAQRNPLSGGNSRHSRSDSLHPKLYIELKSGDQVVNFSWQKAVKLYEETAEKAILEGKYPVVVIKPSGTSAKIEDWTAYIWIWDGSLRGTVVSVPLRTVKRLLDAGLLPTLTTEADPDQNLPPEYQSRLKNLKLAEIILGGAK